MLGHDQDICVTIMIEIQTVKNRMSSPSNISFWIFLQKPGTHCKRKKKDIWSQGVAYLFHNYFLECFKHQMHV
jgi:hypothetical protein